MRSRSDRQATNEGAAQTRYIRPADFPVGSVESRAAVRGLLQQRQVIYTMIVDVPDMPLHLESSRCERVRWPRGEICEIVLLDGRASDISQEDLHEWIEGYPILPG